MRKFLIIALICLIVCLIIGYRFYNYLNSLAPKDYSHLKIGDQAPDFIGKSVYKKNPKDKDFITEVIRLSDFRGKYVILCFYPKDNTPFCTKQMKSFKENYKELSDAGYEIIGISTDNEDSHKKFIDDHELQFRLICDTDRVIHEKYKAWSKKSLFWLGKKSWKTNRMTFIIGKDGITKDIIIKVVAKNHAQQILSNDYE